jgi:hypothetical protein
MELREPQLTNLETLKRRSGYQSLQTVTRPEHWGVDLDRARRPGVPMHREPPQQMAHAVTDIEPMEGESSVPMHGRTNKVPPRVFSTAIPMCGLSGLVRRAAYALPDHRTSHWMLKLLGDRVDVLEHRAMKALPWAAGLAGLVLAIRQSRK